MEIIGNDDAHSRLHGVLVDLERVHTVLEFVADPFDFRRKLLRFSNGNKAGSQIVCQRGSEDESARLDTEDGIGLHWTNLFRERIDDAAKTRLVLQ